MKTKLILFFVLGYVGLFSQKKEPDFGVKYIDKALYENMITKDTLFFDKCARRNGEELKAHMIAFFGQELLNEFKTAKYASSGSAQFNFYAGKDSMGNTCFKTVSCSNTISADSCQNAFELCK